MRRIDPTANDKRDNKLKALAGMIQSLSYREMLRFSDMLELAYDKNGNDEGTAGAGELAQSLVQVADEILGQPEEGRS